MRRTPLGRVAAVLVLALLPLGCGSNDSGSGGGSKKGSSADEMTLYTCVNDTTIQPVIDAFEKAHKGSTVKLFRAPTGELNARVAGDVRSGGLKADVIWACDPLTMQGYVDQHLVGGWTPSNASAIPARFRTADYVGVAVLYMVAIHRKGVAAPRSWSDLTGSAYTKSVAIPDPAFAASALGMVGYFANAKSYGLDFFAALKKNGAKQVSSPDDVTTGVAQGVYKAGFTIASSAYAAKADGSPVDVVWPKPGAIAIYGPAAVATNSKHSALARQFVTYVASASGQEVIGKSGSYPTRTNAPSPTRPAGAPVVYPDWASISKGKTALVRQYQQIFQG